MRENKSDGRVGFIEGVVICREPQRGVDLKLKHNSRIADLSRQSQSCRHVVRSVATSVVRVPLKHVVVQNARSFLLRHAPRRGRAPKDLRAMDGGVVGGCLAAFWTKQDGPWSRRHLAFGHDEFLAPNQSHGHRVELEQVMMSRTPYAHRREHTVDGGEEGVVVTLCKFRQGFAHDEEIIALSFWRSNQNGRRLKSLQRNGEGNTVLDTLGRFHVVEEALGVEELGWMWPGSIRIGKGYRYGGGH